MLFWHNFPVSNNKFVFWVVILPGKLSLINLSIVTQLYGFAINGIVLPDLIKRCPIGIVYECTSSQSNMLKKSS